MLYLWIGAFLISLVVTLNWLWWSLGNLEPSIISANIVVWPAFLGFVLCLFSLIRALVCVFPFAIHNGGL